MKFFTRLLPVLMLSVAVPSISFGSHIIGGEIYYTCLGSHNYQISLVVYRDCTSGTGFDNPAYIGVYNSAGVLIQDLTVSSPTINSIPIISEDPCLDAPPGICVEQAIYTTTVSLPGTDTYTIVYQRCCRNAGIVNIEAPDATGSTYWQVITSDDVANCNSSPYFNNYPPSVICVGENIVFDHSATDPDGDSLSYRFITPYLGASAASPMPIPPPAPPYGNVTWLPAYSEAYQIDASPAFAIDPGTGLLTGVATTEGRYVVGIAVDEYRDGVLLGTHFRDFQFNVVTCTPTIVAATTPYILDCTDNTINFTNTSIGADNYYWDFGDGTNSTAFTPTHTYADTGTYTVMLVANPGFPCADTTYATIKVYNTLTAAFDYTAGCSGTPVIFTDNSVSTEAGDITTWDWTFGDGSTRTTPSPAYEYADGGSYSVTLTVTTDKGCTSTITEPVDVTPGPVADFSTEDICQDQPADFTNESTIATGTITGYLWDFGNGATSTDENPVYNYPAPGAYTVTLIVYSSNGCSDTVSYPISVGEVADAYAGPDDSVQYLASYTLQGSGNGTFTWTAVPPLFGFSKISDIHAANPVVNLENTTTFYLTVTSPDGCTGYDTVTIYVIDETVVAMPNAFSPNGDGLNDILTILNHSVQSLYEYSIYNRWGQQIFTTTDINAGWDGTFNGKPCDVGTYVYVIRGRGNDNKDFNLQGNITLVR